MEKVEWHKYKKIFYYHCTCSMLTPNKSVTAIISDNVYLNVLMTNEMHNSCNQILFHSFCLLYMFRTNLAVHPQEHGII